MPPGRHSSRLVGVVSFGSGTWSCGDEWMSDCWKICWTALNHIVHKTNSPFEWTVHMGGAADPDEAGLVRPSRIRIATRERTRRRVSQSRL